MSPRAHPGKGLRFWQSLAAVVSGNAIYFLLIDPRLPPPYRHELYKLDWGVLIDFWVCLCIWGILEMILQRRRRA
jgi:hypothetical protein